VAPVTVSCPPGITRNAFGQTIYLEKYAFYLTEIHWAAPRAFNLVRGCLDGCGGNPSVRGSGSFTGTIEKCVASPEAGSSVTDDTYHEPYPGTGRCYFYLVRARVPACGATAPGYTANAASESPGRDAEIDVDPVAGTCP
jgi:hypothetical protein